MSRQTLCLALEIQEGIRHSPSSERVHSEGKSEVQNVSAIKWHRCCSMSQSGVDGGQSFPLRGWQEAGNA